MMVQGHWENENYRQIICFIRLTGIVGKQETNFFGKQVLPEDGNRSSQANTKLTDCSLPTLRALQFLFPMDSLGA